MQKIFETPEHAFVGQKYLCLVYYKVTADRSALLGVDMDMMGYFWFKDAFKNITKDIKSQIVWVSRLTNIKW